MSAGASFAAGLVGGWADSREDRLEREKEAQQQVQHASLPMGAPGGSGSGGSGPFRFGAPGAAGGSGGMTGGTMEGGNSILTDLLARHEGGGNFSTLFGHSQRAGDQGDGGKFDGIDVSKMTLGELYQFSDPSGEYGQWVKSKVGRVATPMGFGQIVGTTLRNTASAMGLSPDTVYNEATQRAMVNYLAEQRINAAGGDTHKMLTGLRAEWEGFKNVSDEDLLAAIQQFQANGGRLGERGTAGYRGVQ